MKLEDKVVEISDNMEMRFMKERGKTYLTHTTKKIRLKWLWAQWDYSKIVEVLILKKVYKRFFLLFLQFLQISG